MKMRVSEIRVKQIRVNQGLGVLEPSQSHGLFDVGIETLNCFYQQNIFKTFHVVYSKSSGIVLNT